MKLAAIFGAVVMCGLLFYGVKQLIEWVQRANKAMEQDNED